MTQLKHNVLSLIVLQESVGMLPPILSLFCWLWLVAGADLLWEKNTADWLVTGANLVGEKSTAAGN